MLEDAKKQALEGRNVYVVFANENHKRQIEHKYGHEYRELGVTFVTVQEIKNPNFNWKSLEWTGMPKNSSVIFDHAAIELEYSRILEMLHRYDGNHTKI